MGHPSVVVLCRAEAMDVWATRPPICRSIVSSGGDGCVGHPSPIPFQKLGEFNSILSDCYNGFHKGTGGKVVEFFSLLALTSADKDYVKNDMDVLFVTTTKTAGTS